MKAKQRIVHSQSCLAAAVLFYIECDFVLLQVPAICSVAFVVAENVLYIFLEISRRCKCIAFSRYDARPGVCSVNAYMFVICFAIQRGG